jgi:2-keto-4-pentenoate hydratase/2-oxohepta-3-ene-1,7-dioic acid hydratase in catechol pathway
MDGSHASDEHAWFALATYLTPQGAERVGLALDPAVQPPAGLLPLEAACAEYRAATGERLPEIPADISMLRLLEAWPATSPYLEKLASFLHAEPEAAARARGRLGQVTLLAPVPWPGKIVNVGINFHDHAREMGLVVDPEKFTPNFFFKGDRNCIIGAGQPVRLSSNYVDWEAELAVVMGRKARNIPRESALDHVAGFTCHNDVTDRWIMMHGGTTLDFLGGKGRDTFAPTGPWLVPTRFVPDPNTLPIRLRHNGRLMQDTSTGNMIWGVERCLAYLSTVLTLLPGDVVALGTGAGTGWAEGCEEPKTMPRLIAHMEGGGGVFLRSGDSMAVEIDHVGVLATPVE